MGSILNLRGVYKFELSFVLFEWNLTLIERGVLMNGEKDRRYVQLNKIYITAGQKKYQVSLELTDHDEKYLSHYAIYRYIAPSMN